jgi:hypothetical protein
MGKKPGSGINIPDPQHWKNDVNVPSKSNEQKNFFISFFGVLKVYDENSRADPNPDRAFK